VIGAFAKPSSAAPSPTLPTFVASVSTAPMMLAVPMMFQTTTHARVIHTWVDPKYGQDTTLGAVPGAIQLNPKVNASCTVNGGTPIHVFNPALGPLLHASWPFKTITAAVASIPALPVSATHGTATYRYEYAIVHLMPGLYARAQAYGPAGSPSPDNGLMPNGETFPIDIPDYVSIQGTSALDTMIDLGPANTNNLIGGGPAFRYGMLINSTGKDSFISSVSIFGAYPYGPTNPGSPQSSRTAAIQLADSYASAPTIMNNFLFGNGIGILIQGKTDAQGQTILAHDRTRILNNTIAMNHVGLANTENKSVTQQAKGVSKLILLNNIFDSSQDWQSTIPLPTNWLGNALFQGFGSWSFEGVDKGDIQTQAGLDFNAYEVNTSTNPNPNKYDSGIPILAVGLPATSVRTVIPPQPGTDISVYTGWGLTTTNIRRGTLYVRDLLANGQFQTINGFDYSPHDFRLSPAVAHASGSNSARPAANIPGDISVPNGTGAVNPLVNIGWSTSSSSFTLTMGNGQSLTKRPGFLDLTRNGANSQNTWAHDGWDWDAEGFGNARIQSHNTQIFPIGAGSNQDSPIDIGADELGQMISAGYRFGTRSFLKLVSSNLPAGVKAMDNRYHWFLGVPDTLTLGTGFPQISPINFQQINHLAGPPAAYQYGAPLTYEGPWFDTWTLTASTYYNPKMIDISPHLLPDIHPWWTSTLPGWPTNPIWQWCVPSSGYNASLYLDPTVGIINPPGTYQGGGWQGVPKWQYLDMPGLTPPVGIFGQNVTFRPTTKSWNTTNFDPWCRSHNNKPTEVMDTFLATFTTPVGGTTTYVGLRYSLEPWGKPLWTPNLTDTNVQTFMVIVDDK